MGTEDQIITFQTYYDPMLAQIVRTRLEDAGIQCFIADENMGTLYPTYNATIGGIKLKIFARDKEQCEAIMAEDPSQAIDELPEEAQIFCPHCGSSNVRYVSATGQSEGLFSKLVSLVRSDTLYDQWHCLNCGKDFEKNA